MKNSWMNVVGILPILAIALLTACGGGGGGGGNSSPPGPPPGGIVGSSGATMCVGIGTWYGTVTINDVSTYQQFLFDNGMCQGLQCGRVSQYAQMWITVGQDNGGTLPGPVTFAIQPYVGGFQGNGQSLRADGYINAAQNGILVNYTGNSNYYSYPGQPGYDPNNPANAGLQINTQFSDASHSSMNAQVTYHGRPFANTTTVPLRGQITYNPNNGGQGSCGYGYGYPGSGYGGANGLYTQPYVQPYAQPYSSPTVVYRFRYYSTWN